MSTHLHRAYQATLTAANSIYRLPEVKRRTGLSRSSIYAGIAAGTFPKPLQLGPRAVGWRSGDLDAWIEARPVGLTTEPAGPRRRRTAQAPASLAKLAKLADREVQG